MATQDKAGLLKAVAEGGSQGRTTFQQLQTQLSTSQNDAIRQALSSQIAQDAPQEAGGILGGIIEQGYAPGAGAVGGFSTATGKHTMSTEAALAKYLAEMAPILQMATTQYQARLEAELAAAMAEEAERAARSGGSGRSGSGSAPKPGDWWKAISGDFDTKENFYKYIRTGVGGYDRTPAFIARREVAVNEFGVPEGAAVAQFQPGAWQQWAVKQAQQAATQGTGLKPLKRLLRRAASNKKAAPGSQNRATQYAVDIYKSLGR
jgi:hypothetical protein